MKVSQLFVRRGQSNPQGKQIYKNSSLKKSLWNISCQGGGTALIAHLNTCGNMYMEMLIAFELISLIRRKTFGIGIRSYTDKASIKNDICGTDKKHWTSVTGAEPNHIYDCVGDEKNMITDIRLTGVAFGKILRESKLRNFHRFFRKYHYFTYLLRKMYFWQFYENGLSI